MSTEHYTSRHFGQGPGFPRREWDLVFFKPNKSVDCIQRITDMQPERISILIEIKRESGIDDFCFRPQEVYHD